MPNGPQTWNMLKALQAQIQSEVVVGGVSPFTVFSASDATKYGATNAIYIAHPKNFSNAYRRQCHIVPSVDESVYHRSGGGGGAKIWDESYVYVRFLYYAVDDWYQAMQDLFAARDAAYVVMNTHARLPGANQVEAAKVAAQAKGNVPLGLYYAQEKNQDWLCWGFLWWLRQEWTVAGGIID